MDENAVRQVMARLGIPALHKSAKGWINARCPLAPWTHKNGEDRHPAFAIMVCDDGVSHYRCLGCHWKGRVSQLVRSIERLNDTSFGSLAYDCDVWDTLGVFGSGFEQTERFNPYEEPVSIDETMVEGLYPPAFEVDQAAVYLDGRGISIGTAELLGLCWDPDERRVLFPCRGRNRELYGFTGRTVLEEKFWPYRAYQKVRDYLGLPKAGILLGSELIQRDKPSFVVEGLFGYAHLIEIGARDLCNPLALLGSELTAQKANILTALNVGTYLMADNDEAGESFLFGRKDPITGRQTSEGAVDLLQSKGLPIFVPPWPDGKDDPDELTIEEVREIIDRCPLYGF